MAKTVELCLRNRNGEIVAWCAGYSDDDINALLKKHPDWYRSSEAFYN